MIEPYESMVRRVAPLLSGLGFARLADSSHSTRFRRDGFTLEFIAERYEELALSSTLVHESDDSDVGAMHIADAMRAIAPERLTEIQSIDLETRAGLSAAVLKEVEFLRDCEAVVFVRPAPYRVSYEEQHRPPWATRVGRAE